MMTATITPGTSMAKTIRLQNISQSNLSLELNYLVAATRGSMRKPSFLPISIPLGRYYDVCAQLKVDFQEAERILRESPMVERFTRLGHIRKIYFPPPPEVVPPPAPIVAAVEAPVELPPVEVAVEAPAAVAAAPVAPMQVRVIKEPSMDWTESELRDYAQAAGVDVSGAKSKTAVLKTIREKK